MNFGYDDSTILIVDDVVTNIELLGRMIKYQGFNIEFATSGKEALDFIKSNNVDLILLDIAMPEMDGYEVCKILKTNDATKDIPVIFMTAMTSVENKVKAFELGAVDYIIKPFQSNEVIARVNTHLVLSNLQKQLKNTNIVLEQKVKDRTKQYLDANRELIDRNLQIMTIYKELKHAKDKIDEQENLLRTFVNHSISWETLRATNGDLLISTPAFEKISGFSNADYLNGTISLLDICHPDDRLKIAKTYKEAVNQKAFTNFEFRIIDKYKTIKYLLASINHVYLKDGQYFGIRLSVLDITEQKIAQEKADVLLQAIEHSRLSILITNAEGIIEYVNSEFERVSGFSRQEAIGKNSSILKSDLTQSEIYKKMWDTLKSKKEWRGELCNKKKNGELFWEYVIISVLTDENNKITHYVAVKEDITEQKELDKKMLQAVVEAEEKERIRIAQELHDGVGPLISSAKMFVQSILKTNSKTDKFELAINTEELLNEAQKTVRQISFSLSPHVLQNFGFIEAIKSFAQKIECAKNIIININSNLYNPLNINTETILYRILCECINNTIKHAEASKIDINFNYKDNYLKITYIDNGKGFNYEEAINRKTGIGLYNMKNRIEILNGTFNIVTLQGKGTKIIFSINKI